MNQCDTQLFTHLPCSAGPKYLVNYKSLVKQSPKFSIYQKYAQKPIEQTPSSNQYDYMGSYEKIKPRSASLTMSSRLKDFKTVDYVIGPGSYNYNFSTLRFKKTTVDMKKQQERFKMKQEVDERDYTPREQKSSFSIQIKQKYKQKQPDSFQTFGKYQINTYQRNSGKIGNQGRDFDSLFIGEFRNIPVVGSYNIEQVKKRPNSTMGIRYAKGEHL